MKNNVYLLVSLCVMFIAGACDQSSKKSSESKSKEKQEYDAKYLNPELSIDKRVDALVSEMTLEEKTSQMLYDSKAIPRLDVPKYNWWNEALHGVARSSQATVFPQAIGMAAMFDKKLMHDIGTAVSDEARAIHNEAVDKGFRAQYSGLTFWSPNVNIFRDARWGRGQETYGEDPYLTGKLAVNYINGLQGDHPEYLKVSAGAKHYLVHSGPEKDRHHFNAKASKKDMYETYLPAFKMAIDAGVESVMCAYNRTNSELCCGSSNFLLNILRKKWGFDGHILSDCWALVDFHENHQVTDSAVQSAAVAANNGVNLNCGTVYNHLDEAVKQGMVTKDTLNKRLKKLLETRFELGLFDPEEMNPYSDLGKEDINTEENRELSREAGRKCVTLLKNDNNTLPLEKDINKLFVTGPTAADIEVLIGNYYGVNSNFKTLLEGITGKVSASTQVMYRKGATLKWPTENPMNYAAGQAGGVDATIIGLGISNMIEGEEGAAIASAHKGDKKSLDLPENQITFLKQLSQGHDKPIIAVVFGGSPLDLRKVEKYADAVMFAWYPGQEGGTALADIIFGDYVPSGRLPLTFPKSVDQLPPYDDYSMEGRTYKYMNKEPLYPFGYGLSYTQFAYNDISLSSNSMAKDNPEEISVTVNVKNTGDFDAEEVVQLYISDVNASVRVPNSELKRFKRVKINQGESKEVSFTLSEDDFEIVDNYGDKILETGDFKIIAGGASPMDKSEKLGIDFSETTFTVE